MDNPENFVSSVSFVDNPEISVSFVSFVDNPKISCSPRPSRIIFFVLIRYLSGLILITMAGRRIFLIVLLWITFLRGASAQWKAYLSYYEPTEIEQASDGTLYILASGGIYSYNPSDQQIITYDKTKTLSDCGIANIAWCQAAKRLVIVYNDYNIDLLAPNGNVINMTDYMNALMTADKTVNRIDVAGRYAYLSTNFGIVQIDVANATFANTYSLGFRVDYTYSDSQYLYAASSTNGIYRGLLAANLLDPNQWTKTSNYTASPKIVEEKLRTLVSTLKPEGPKSNFTGLLKIHNGKLYVSSALPHINEKEGIIQVYDGQLWASTEDWESIKEKTGQRFSSLFDFDIDPKDDNHMYVGCQSGLYEFENLQFTKLWNDTNSPLKVAATVPDGNKDYTITTATKFDNYGKLWVFNSISPSTSILDLTNGNEWTPHHKQELMVDNISPARSFEQMSGPIFDSRKLMWFTNAFYRDPSLICYNTSSDEIKVFKDIINEDGITFSTYDVSCVAEDMNHNIWIGTDRGPLMLPEDQITADSPVFTQVKVPRNDGTDYADYLLSGVDINCLVIDKANRKWFGTSGNGIYVIDSDNITQLQHFTKDNSGLISDHINSMALNEATGEMFIATDEGLCSYTSYIPSSQDEGMTKDNVYAYPNPVRPDYNGVITITGLTNDADVKITTSNGVLVNQGRATNGQYLWYGLDSNGKRVASGIYMVMIATAEGDKGVVCKIAIIN